MEAVEQLGVTWEEGQNLDYATLAKAGGRRDLLHHVVAPPSAARTPAPPSVDWFAHPEAAKHDINAKYDSHLKDHWCQWNTMGTEIPKLPEIDKLHKFQPPLPTQRDNVDFTRLMSLDYQREWLDKRKEKEEKLKKRMLERKASQLRKAQEHAMKTRKKAHSAQQDKRFIMKRFKKIPSKVKLPPI